MKARAWILCGMLLANGCEREAVVSGQVFVVTRGRENIKMGLVPIKIYSATEFTRVKDESAKVVEEQSKISSANAEKLRTEAERARQKLNELQAELSEMERQEDRLKKTLVEAETGSPAFSKAAEERLTLLSKMSDQEDAKNKATDSLNELSARLREAAAKTYPMVDAILARLGTPVAEGKTDADGKFQIRIAKADYVIVASASRELGGNAEFYTWFIPHRAGSGSDPILLSNDNVERSK